jgi:hypothetical protein
MSEINKIAKLGFREATTISFSEVGVYEVRLSIKFSFMEVSRAPEFGVVEVGVLTEADNPENSLSMESSASRESSSWWEWCAVRPATPDLGSFQSRYSTSNF